MPEYRSEVESSDQRPGVYEMGKNFDLSVYVISVMTCIQVGSTLEQNEENEEGGYCSRRLAKDATVESELPSIQLNLWRLEEKMQKRKRTR